MNKEYRPIRHVYSLGHKLPTGGLGDGPYEIKYSVTAGFCKYLLIISLESHMTFSNTKYELQNDRGNLFKNKKKKNPEEIITLSPVEKDKNEKKPDWSGKLKMNEQEFWLSAWEKRTKNGELFFSVSLGGMVPAEPTQHSIDKGNGYAPSDRKDSMDDDIPF
jgi:hypothetical protein